jgi:hypothetical protein
MGAAIHYCNLKVHPKVYGNYSRAPWPQYSAAMVYLIFFDHLCSTGHKPSATYRRVNINALVSSSS